MTEAAWHEARLIPTSGISGAEEQEQRATSALLAVLGAVREFGQGLLKPLGAPSGLIETFVEVPFDLAGRRIFPDGLIRVTRGKREWVSLVEVKTGRNNLNGEQLENYLDVAKEQGFDALITISNEIPPAVGVHPTKVDKRKLRKVAIHHWSWTFVLSTAVVQKEHRGVSDPEQAWILGELIRYLEHPRSGAMELEDMGSSWVPVRQAVTSGTLRSGDVGAADVVARWDALLRYVGLRLGRELGTDVTQVLSRKEVAEPQLRVQALVESLASQGQLFGALKVPDAVAPIHITADLRAGQVSCHVDVEAPREGRPTTRVNWLIRQLKNAPADARLEAFVLNGRGPGVTELLGKVRDDPSLLVQDPKREIKSFRVAVSFPLGTKRGRGRGAFIDSVVESVDTCYADVLQQLKAWVARPPRMRDVDLPPAKESALSSTALSSQDGPDYEGQDS
ncbi:hypothetical protein NF556_12160 [Ornithinimicrobium faecis]|uniref:Stress response protein n=1 Tax=Ornithinimicrobium faecis TaxID=2934158 RepID=A0ABY4YNW1_9MICO|nr:hypothetical protein [Ornithinimicrobium sp. HY1793]USQ78398.1 hypothetical protein NF556_12160 [Ornithinimicrobium sp. HY1793]